MGGPQQQAIDLIEHEPVDALQPGHGGRFGRGWGGHFTIAVEGLLDRLGAADKESGLRFTIIVTIVAVVGRRHRQIAGTRHESHAAGLSQEHGGDARRLRGEFPRGRQHDGDSTISIVVLIVTQQVFRDGQQIGQRLARARGGVENGAAVVVWMREREWPPVEWATVW